MEEKKPSISKMDFFNFAKEAYYKEFDRRTALNSEIGMQVTAIVAICGISVIMYKEIKPLLATTSCQLSGVAITFFILDFACLVFAIFFVLNSYFLITESGRSYDYLPISEITDEFLKEEVDKDGLVNRMIKTCSDSTESNGSMNNCKSTQLNRSSKFLTGSVACTFIVSILYLIIMSENNNSQSGGSGNSGSGGQQQQAPAPKPAEVKPFVPQKIQERSENPQIDRKTR